MSNSAGLRDVTEAAAEVILQLTSSWEVSVTLIDRGSYWDVVDVSVDTSRPRFSNQRYPLSDFPLGSERLLAGKGYFSGDAADEVLVEYESEWPDVPLGSLMSVPIIALGGVHGEIFLVRDKQTPRFNRDDLDLVSDLATLLGARLPALVAAYADTESESGDAAPMVRLTRNLDAVLRD